MGIMAMNSRFKKLDNAAYTDNVSRDIVGICGEI